MTGRAASLASFPSWDKPFPVLHLNPCTSQPHYEPPLPLLSMGAKANLASETDFPWLEHSWLSRAAIPPLLYHLHLSSTTYVRCSAVVCPGCACLPQTLGCSCSQAVPLHAVDALFLLGNNNLWVHLKPKEPCRCPAHVRSDPSSTTGVHMEGKGGSQALFLLWKLRVLS